MRIGHGWLEALWAQANWASQKSYSNWKKIQLGQLRVRSKLKKVKLDQPNWASPKPDWASLKPDWTSRKPYSNLKSSIGLPIILLDSNQPDPSYPHLLVPLPLPTLPTPYPIPTHAYPTNPYLIPHPTPFPTQTYTTPNLSYPTLPHSSPNPPRSLPSPVPSPYPTTSTPQPTPPATLPSLNLP